MRTLITSPHNERLKLVRALQTQGKTRRKEGRMVLEGVRLIQDALHMGVDLHFALCSSDTITTEAVALLGQLEAHNIPCLEVIPDLMQQVTDTQTSQGILAVVSLPELALPAQPSFVLLLDGIADPGNLGTALRTAAAVGVDGVWLLPGCVDPYNPKVLRAGMGAHFRVPIVQRNWTQAAEDLTGVQLYIADMQGDLPYFNVNWTLRSGVIIGGEARGVAEAAYTHAQGTLYIPMENQAESLNAAMACAVILFEGRRQRFTAR